MNQKRLALCRRLCRAVNMSLLHTDVHHRDLRVQLTTAVNKSSALVLKACSVKTISLGNPASSIHG